MTREEFIQRAMISMASNHSNLHTDTICTSEQVKKIARAAEMLADAAEDVACFD